jgi:cysteinyl-tRNA synthetase
MHDDFHTPAAMAELQSRAPEINTAKTAGDQRKAGRGAAELRALAARLGFLKLDPDAFLRKRPARQAATVAGSLASSLESATGNRTGTSASGLADADIDRLIDERATARKAKNFMESDRIRDLLAASGVVLEDQPGGRTLWRRG